MTKTISEIYGLGWFNHSFYWGRTIVPTEMCLISYPKAEFEMSRTGQWRFARKVD